ncbi:hypothetical protein EL17_11750 [Anditalea andensis]|uniref:Uncharacterized protein n=1 Tax=Anditalea andensis TaxID=1048983 RepID=A0A074LIG6_9BACT|nr:hypothetical protein EL17_11750 [Anditalea andensis]
MVLLKPFIHQSGCITKTAKHPLQFSENDYIKTPVGFAIFYELPAPPCSYIVKSFNITYWTIMHAGVHFAGMEQTDLLAIVLKDFFNDLVH